MSDEVGSVSLWLRRERVSPLSSLDFSLSSRPRRPSADVAYRAVFQQRYSVQQRLACICSARDRGIGWGLVIWFSSRSRTFTILNSAWERHTFTHWHLKINSSEGTRFINCPSLMSSLTNNYTPIHHPAPSSPATVHDDRIGEIIGDEIDNSM